MAIVADISNYIIGKMDSGENATTDILGKIYAVLDCSVKDITDLIPESDNMKLKYGQKSSVRCVRQTV